MRGLLAGLFVALAACGPTVEDAEGNGEAEGGATSSPTGGGSDSPGPMDTTPCPMDPDFTCPFGIDCGRADCGELDSAFDADGCMRPACPCEDGFVCFVPLQWGGCASSGPRCDIEDGTCRCIEPADCHGAHCVPAEEAPIPPCVGLTSQPDCDAAGCAWLSGPGLRLVDGECTCEVASGLCVPPATATPGSGWRPGHYRFDAPDVVVMVDEGGLHSVAGLWSCFDKHGAIREVAPACACVGVVDC